MGSILVAGALVATILRTVLLKVLADDSKALLPWISERVVRRAVRSLPESQRERYNEEWRSHQSEMPGEIAKLFAALGFLKAGWRMSKILSGRTSQLPVAPKSTKPGPAVSGRIFFGTPVPKDDVSKPGVRTL